MSMSFISGNLTSGQKLERSMIRLRLKELIAEKEYREDRRITFDEIARETGIHRTTLSKISNQRGHKTNTDVLDRLCTYFQVPIEDLAEHIDGRRGRS